MEYQTIKFEKNDGFAIITLNRPDKLNALNNLMLAELDECVKTIETSKDIFALIITGSGEKAFAAGADIAELQLSNQQTGKIFSEYGSYVFKRIEQLRIPVIAAINGFALGGGCELALACHIRFGSEKAKLGQPEVNLGIIPGYGGTQRLPKVVGKAKAMELIISGNLVNAEEALRIGLLNQVYSAEELLDKAIEFVSVVLSKGRLAVSASVDCILQSENLSLLEGLHYESCKFGEVCGTKDFKEGTAAYLEKRPADFKNKLIRDDV